MILKKYDKELIINKKICLFHGKNEGKKDIILNELKKIFNNNFQVFYEKDLIQNFENFYNQIYLKSFFEKEKLLIVRNVTDKLLLNIQNIIERGVQDVLIILLSDILEKKSKLRSLFEKDINLISLPFYPDDNQTLVSYVSKFFRERNISVSYETINYLVNKTNGERKFLTNELEKIEIFLKNKKNISNSEIDKLINVNENTDLSNMVDNCLAKNKNKIIFLMNENNLVSDDLIMIIRIFLSKTKKLLLLVENFSLNKNIDKTILEAKPPIFWKDKEIIKKQIKSWNIKQLEKLIIEINEIEYLVKTNSQNSKLILSDFILNKSS